MGKGEHERSKFAGLKIGTHKFKISKISPHTACSSLHPTHLIISSLVRRKARLMFLYAEELGERERNNGKGKGEKDGKKG